MDKQSFSKGLAASIPSGKIEDRCMKWWRKKFGTDGSFWYCFLRLVTTEWTLRKNVGCVVNLKTVSIGATWLIVVFASVNAMH